MKVPCVFCGKEPENKNKEHIFPKWLLKLTGADKGNLSVGSNWKTGEELTFNMLSYTFPSCTICNSDFGKLEGKVKPIFDKLINDQDVLGQELELLLDWFDKVRIGSWFGVKYMNKDGFTSQPRFYINSRVGLKDRFLSITNTYKYEKELNWSGVNGLAFMMSPTAFSLRVNNLVFVNCSSDFVVSKRLGFPYVKFEIPKPDSIETDVKFGMPKKKAVPKLFHTRLYSPSITISQPIYKVVKSGLSEYYDHAYVKDNSYDFSNGIGKIFISKKNAINTIERNEKVNFSMPEAKNVHGHIEVVRPILELQAELIKTKKRDLRNLSVEQKRNDIIGRKYLLDYLKKQMRKFRY
ncbi:MAG: hypothetical protein ACI88H_003617 [Cocleimonas sp.]